MQSEFENPDVPSLPSARFAQFRMPVAALQQQCSMSDFNISFA
jgi:hypothetical protein